MRTEGLVINVRADRNTLHLATGELSGKTMAELLKLNHVENFFEARFDLMERCPAYLEAEHHVFFNRHMWEQGVALKYHADIAVLNGYFGYIFVIEQNLPDCRNFQARHHS